MYTSPLLSSARSNVPAPCCMYCGASLWRLPSIRRLRLAAMPESRMGAFTLIAPARRSGRAVGQVAAVGRGGSHTRERIAFADQPHLWGLDVIGRMVSLCPRLCAPSCARATPVREGKALSYVSVFGQWSGVPTCTAHRAPSGGTAVCNRGVGCRWVCELCHLDVVYSTL